MESGRFRSPASKKVCGERRHGISDFLKLQPAQMPHIHTLNQSSSSKLRLFKADPLSCPRQHQTHPITTNTITTRLERFCIVHSTTITPPSSFLPNLTFLPTVARMSGRPSVFTSQVCLSVMLSRPQHLLSHRKESSQALIFGPV